MALVRFLKDKFNLALCGFVALFFLAPFLESQPFSFPVMPFIWLIILFLNLRMLSLPQKYFSQLFLLAVLAFSFDLLLIFILNRSLEGVLTVLIYGIYGFCFAACLWMVVKNLFSFGANLKDLLKMGICGYFLIGFLWMVIYSFIYALDPEAFFGCMIEEIRFFHFSFSTLTLLIPPWTFRSLGLWVKYLANLEAIAGQVFLVILIVRLVILYESYKVKR